MPQTSKNQMKPELEENKSGEMEDCEVEEEKVNKAYSRFLISKITEVY